MAANEEKVCRLNLTVYLDMLHHHFDHSMHFHQIP